MPENEVMVGDLKLSDAINIYNAYRSKIVDENNFINHRISWMLWSEAILFAIWAALAIPERLKINHHISAESMAVISLFGFYVAFISRRSVNAAKCEISEIVRRYKLRHEALYDSKNLIPKLNCNEIVSMKGSSFGMKAPIIFMFIHFCAFIYSVCIYQTSYVCSP